MDLFRVDESGPAAISLNINSITNLPESLAAKQPLLSTEAGLSVSQTVKDTFALASSGDGVNHSTSLLTAKAVEDWFESLMPNLVTIQSGQTGNAVRVSTINSASTSAVNLPSCSAVANHVTYRLASYLTSVPSEYLNQTECDARYLQSFTIPSEYLTEMEGDAKYLQSFTIPSQCLTQTQCDARYLQSFIIPSEYLTQTEGDARYLQNFTIPSQYLTETEGDARYLQNFMIPSEYLTQTEGDARYCTLNQISTAAKIGIGYESGSVSLTRNDNYGNANVCFNHAVGTPDSTGSEQSSGRIECTVDSSNAAMIFGLADSVTQDTAVDTVEILKLQTSLITCLKSVQCNDNLTVNGTLNATASGNLTQSQGDVRYLQSIPNEYLTETECDTKYLQSFTIPNEYLTETEGDTRYLRPNVISTGTTFGIGQGSGSVGLTVNDGGGNASLTFNHVSRLPDNTAGTQSAARISSNVDATGANLVFSLSDSTTQGTSVITTTVMILTPSLATYLKSVQCNDNLTVNGTLTANLTGTASGNLTQSQADTLYLATTANAASSIHASRLQAEVNTGSQIHQKALYCSVHYNANNAYPMISNSTGGWDSTGAGKGKILFGWSNSVWIQGGNSTLRTLRIGDNVSFTNMPSESTFSGGGNSYLVYNTSSGRIGITFHHLTIDESTTNI